jgi:hypothetical protein
MSAVQKWLKLTTRKCLLIFDNVERESILKGYWLVGAKGAILITSHKYYNFMKDGQRKCDTVKPFNEQQSFDLLMVLLGENWQNQYSRGLIRSTEIAAAKTLLKKIGSLALTIQQAAVLINNPDIGGNNIAGALELFNSNAQRLPERPDTDRSEMDHALDTLWNMNLSDLTPNARNLLNVLAMLSTSMLDTFQNPAKLPRSSFHPDARKHRQKIKRGLQGFVNGSKSPQSRIQVLLRVSYPRGMRPL